MKPFCIALFTVALAQFSAGADPRPSSDVEIRFCPAARVHTYPLESQRDIQSLLLQNMAVINHGSTLFKIEGIDLELLQAGQVVDSRKLDSAAAQRFAERGAKTQGAGMIEAVAFQFCGTDLIAPDVKVTGPSLEKDQALLITSQVFAFSGKRDTLRARARGSLDGRAHEIARHFRSVPSSRRTATSSRSAASGMPGSSLLAYRTSMGHSRRVRPRHRKDRRRWPQFQRRWHPLRRLLRSSRLRMVVS